MSVRARPLLMEGELVNERSGWAHRTMGRWWCGLSWHGSCGFVWRDASCSGALCKWNRFERGAS